MTSVGHSAESSRSGEGVRTLTAAAIAELSRGELRGDPTVLVMGVAPLHRAGEGDLTFLSTGRYAPFLAGRSPAVLLVTPELADVPGNAGARVICRKPQEALLELLPRLYAAPSREPGVHETARIGRGVQLGDDVAIGPYAVIGDGVSVGDRVTIDAHTVVGAGVSLGRDTHLYPHVTVYSGAVLGQRVVVHAGVRLASDGYGYVFGDGVHRKIPHVGRCVIQDDVEIGANSTIDRGSIDDTVIGAGTKIDNLVQIGHNVTVGKLCLIMSQVGLAGSTRVGDGCILAGQVGVSGHLEIGDGARLGAQAGVFGDIPAGETWSGYPARPHKEALRASAALFRLAGLMRKLERVIEDRE